MFIDTHCHLNMMVDKKRDEVMTDQQLDAAGAIIESAQQVGVSRIVNVGTTLNETHNSISLARRYSSVVATAGIHPCDAENDWQTQLGELEKIFLSARDHIVAFGETGLDFYHQPFDAAVQERLFRGHIELACTYDLPLVVHVREAGADALRILREYKEVTRGVVHCFSLDLAAAQEIATWGDWYIGIDGPVTYPKNDWLREVVRTVSLELMILETDAPFLPVQSRRGKQNSPEYLPAIAECIAQERGCSVQDVATITTANACRLFSLT